MSLRPKELAKRAATYRRMAEKALDPSSQVDFMECAERYEIAVQAIARRPATEELEEVG